MRATDESWWRLIVKTAGLAGGVNFQHPYDYLKACPVCGVGAVPLEPLSVQLSKMGRKLLDRTAHEGHVIVATRLAEAISSARLTGVEIHPVRGRGVMAPDPRFHWLQINEQWPRMAPTSVLSVDDLCPNCQRTGYFDPAPEYGRWCYEEPPVNAADFNCTWERFGYWRGKAWRPEARGVGGAPGLIISDRARLLLEHLGGRLLEYVPIEFAGRLTKE